VTIPTLERPSLRTPKRAPVRTSGPGPARHLVAERRPFHSIPRATWERLRARNPWATPFSAWAFHCAWWDGYGESAHEQNLVIVDPTVPASPDGSGPEPVAIVPLMHRHVVEAADATTHTTIRHGGTEAALTSVPPSAKAVYFGASYHADYATILGDPAEFPAVAEAVAEALGAAGHVDPEHPAEWDVVDLRRLRRGDPAIEALAAAFGAREIHEGWTLNLEREDVCPVATLPAGATLDDYLGTLGKKDRHEIRRKVRRAEAAGEVRFDESRDPLAAGPDGRTDLDVFIDLHQARWGESGLFPDTLGGVESRAFIRRLFEEFGVVAAVDVAGGDAAAGSSVPGSPIRLSFLWIGDRRVASSIHFETSDSILYYNAGVDPAAFELSPGVLLVWSLVRRALETGRTRLDFLRGDEGYKYEWGAVDEPIQRLLVRRSVA